MSGRKATELTRVTIHAAGVRVLTYLGGERNLVLGGLLFALYLTFVVSMRYGLWYGAPAGAVIWALWITLMRKLALSDPQMWQVLKRHRRYRSFYPARGRITAPLRSFKDFFK